MANKKSLNAVVLGKSGVGKSSFLNYLVGKSVFQTGEGAPVTQRYFEHVDSKGPSGITYRLYDTKGAEPTTAGELRSKVLELIEKHDASDNMFDWIHTVYYCFAAPAKRIEPYEIELIKELSKTTTVIVLLTKKDMVSASELEALEEQIRRETSYRVQVLPVCSVSAVTRKGSSEPEGKEDVLKASFYGLWEKLSITLPKMMFRQVIAASSVSEIEVFMRSPHSGLSEDFFYNIVLRTYPKEKIKKYAIRCYKPVHWLVDRIQQCRKKNSPYPNAISLADWNSFPNLHSLGLESRTAVREMLQILEQVAEKLHTCNLGQIRRQMLAIVEEAQGFYAQLNNSRLAKLKLHNSDEVWEEIVVYNEENSEKIAIFINKLLDEGLLSMRFPVEKMLQSFFDELEQKFHVYSKAFKIELHQYAQYCILDEDVIRGGR